MRPTGVFNLSHEDTRSQYNSHHELYWIIYIFHYIDGTTYNSSRNYPRAYKLNLLGMEHVSFVFCNVNSQAACWGHETIVETYHERICGATWQRFGSTFWMKSRWSWKLIGLTIFLCLTFTTFFKSRISLSCLTMYLIPMRQWAGCSQSHSLHSWHWIQWMITGHPAWELETRNSW